MPVTSAWTAPSSLDLSVGSILTEAIWDNLVSNELYLWDTLHNYARAAQVQSLLVGAADTDVYRAGANILATHDAFYAGSDILANQALTHQLTLTQIAGQAGIYFSNANDTQIARVSAGVLGTNSEWRATKGTTTGSVLSAFVTGDTWARLIVDASGNMSWSPGSVGGDATLRRSATGVLEVGGALNVTGNITAPNVAQRLARLTPSGVSTVTFSSIPATYRHLEIRGVARSSAAANTDNLRLQVNASGAAIYDWEHILTVGTTAPVPSYVVGDSGVLVGSAVPAANTNANLFASTTIQLHEYASGVWKPVLAELIGADPAGVILKGRVVSGAVIETTTAISSVTMYLNTGNFVAGSSFDLWGLP
jgi:hypothetical protein